MVQRRSSREINAKCGLTHGRSACNDDHLARLQALRHVVDVTESGWHAFGNLAVLQSVDLVEGVGDDGADRRVILPHFAGRHFVDFGLKFKLGYDDSLDVVGVHGVGGFTGTVLIGFFGEGTGLFAGGDWKQLVVQLIVALVAIIWSAVVTGIIAFALEKTIGWRVTEAQEVGGIDLADQGERAYDFAGTASSVLKEVK